MRKWIILILILFLTENIHAENFIEDNLIVEFNHSDFYPGKELQYNILLDCNDEMGYGECFIFGLVNELEGEKEWKVCCTDNVKTYGQKILIPKDMRNISFYAYAKKNELCYDDVKHLKTIYKVFSFSEFVNETQNETGFFLHKNKKTVVGYLILFVFGLFFGLVIYLVLRKRNEKKRFAEEHMG